MIIFVLRDPNAMLLWVGVLQAVQALVAVANTALGQQDHYEVQKRGKQTRNQLCMSNRFQV